MNKQIICPACGSEQIERLEKQSFGQLTMGPAFTFNEIIYKCSSCDEEGDFFAESDKSYLAAQKDAEANLVKQTLDDLNSQGITMAYIERVLELPARTLTRWKTGDFSSSAIALLRIIKTYPWIIEVAEHKFISSFAKAAFLNAAMKEVVDNLKKELSVSTQNVEMKSDNAVTPYNKVITQVLPRIVQASRYQLGSA